MRAELLGSSSARHLVKAWQKHQFFAALVFAAICQFVVSAWLQAGETPSALLPSGGARGESWSGLLLDSSPGSVGAAQLTLPGEATYRVPDGPKGWFRQGLLTENDGTIDARGWYGVRFEVELDREDPLELELVVRIPPQPDRNSLLNASSGRAFVRGKGWHTVTVPFASFDYNRGQSGFLKYLKELTLKARYSESRDGDAIKVRAVRLVLAHSLHLASSIRSSPGEAGGKVTYNVTLTNCADVPQHVSLQLQHTGWEGLPADVSPRTLALAPGETKTATLTVTIPADVPPGAHESQTLVALPEGGSSEPETLEFTTLRRLPAPYVIHDAKGWAELRAKVAQYPWAKKEAAQIIRQADDFEVPVVPAGGIPSDQGTPAVFKSYIEQRFWPTAFAWKLTGEKKYAEKAALFLRRLSDPENGYPKTLHANSQGIPQEGGFFEGCARAYDAIQDADVLSSADREQIERTFRLYIASVEDGMANGGISNWSVFNLCPAAVCALVVQDLQHYHYLINGPCGIADHIRYGIMDDGWWYEMSLSYNLGCAEALTALAIAAQPFGEDLLHQKFPIALTRKVGLRPFEFENFLGMSFGKYGPLTHTSVTIKQMWDGIAFYPDYRGVMFGMGDGHEHLVAGRPFELAYQAFRDPVYAGIIKRGQDRDLLFGVADLPSDTPKLYQTSTHSDNAGIAVLRSQTDGREAREQIQAAFKYGTHGSYHGHFDRISLLSLMRYGRSFYNPETSWYGYGSYMYKWWVQPSLAHNMVVVDAKEQEPQECRPLLFYSGKSLQAVAAETVTRWSNPPYFGGYDQLAAVQSGDAPFVPVPELHPKPGELTGYTEPVRQRRLIIVTDDYVVVADDLRAEQEHTFDQLMHFRDAQLADPASARLLGHDAQFDPNPLGSGQFITDVTRYAVKAPAQVHSVHRFGATGQNSSRWETGGAKSLSEPGVLKIDEHMLWPRQAEIAIGSYPESWKVAKKLSYNVKGDETILTSGVLNPWILGSRAIDLDITGVKTLRLQTQVVRAKDTLNTLFWGHPVVVTSEGTEIPLSELKAKASNRIDPPNPGEDYEGGPICLAGTPYTDAIAAEPRDANNAAEVAFDLTGLQAKRFKTVVGGDWPVGDEEQVRKTVSVRVRGKNAQFLTVLEPYETQPLIKDATASSASSLRVRLGDGRIQTLVIHGWDNADSDLSVELEESKDGETIRQETAR